jgi:hypothetical protein
VPGRDEADGERSRRHEHRAAAGDCLEVASDLMCIARVPLLISISLK